MIFSWYPIFKVEEFPANLTSRIYKVTLVGLGDLAIEVVKANRISFKYGTELLPIPEEPGTPYVGLSGDFATYLDEDGNAYLGMKAEA